MATDHSHSSLTAAAAAAAEDDVGVNSPDSRRPDAWASVVRGNSERMSPPTASAVSAAPGFSSAPPGQALGSGNYLGETSGHEAQPESSDANSEGNAGGPRRSAWNIPSNSVVDGGSFIGGDVSWPALSESTRPGLRSSFDSVRPGSDLPASTSQAPIISTPPRRQVNANSSANSTAPPTRPRSRNRGGGGGGGSPSVSGPSQNNFGRPSNPPPPPPPPPPFPIFGLPYELIPPILNTPVRGTRPVGGGEGSQSHVGNDHSSPRNTSRRGGNYGSRPRGDGPYHSNHGGWRDQDRRDVHLSPHYGPPPPLGYMPPPIPAGAPPFMVPPPVRLIPGQMGFDMASPFIYVPTVHPEAFGVMSMVPPSPPPPLPYPASNVNPLSNLIVSQIDYYFSDVNLMTDNFLKSNMDDHGWVPITLIASFPRVHLLTQDIPLILESLRCSTVVEVQGDKVRRVHEWDKWLNTSVATPENALATSLQETSLDDTTTNENANIDAQVDMASGRLTGSSRLANGDDGVEEVHSISV
ncbi:la-related protein 1C-like isoform X2 [Primulina eburnea]|uniref:la-related protein 1C-like isoform X2 n=1 Tax=Primulina eburnea TaxID=1245227 RepID=UPI003C6BF579